MIFIKIWFDFYQNCISYLSKCFSIICIDLLMRNRRLVKRSWIRRRRWRHQRHRNSIQRRRFRHNSGWGSAIIRLHLQNKFNKNSFIQKIPLFKKKKGLIRPDYKVNSGGLRASLQRRLIERWRRLIERIESGSMARRRIET